MTAVIDVVDIRSKSARDTEGVLSSLGYWNMG